MSKKLGWIVYRLKNSKIVIIIKPTNIKIIGKVKTKIQK